MAVRQAVLLGTASGFFQGFVVSLPTVSLTGIADTFEIPESLSPIGEAILLIGLGSIAGALMALFIERTKRARVAVWSLLILTVLTGVSGLAPSLGVLTALQVGARAVSILVFASAVVLVTELSPARERGRNVTLVVFAGSAGAVAAFLARAALDRIGVSPQVNWRILFFMGLLSLVVPVTAWRASMTLESSSIKAPRRGSSALQTLWSGDRGQLIQVCAIFFFAYMGFMGAATWWVPYAVAEHGMRGEEATIFVAIALAFGFAGYLVMGRAQDTIGRRRAAAIALGGALLFGFGVYLSGSTILMVMALMGAAFFGLGASPILTAISAEIFPKSARLSAVAIARGLFGTIGAVAGPLTVAVLANRTGEAISGTWEGALITLAALIPAILLVQTLPEPASRDLDQIEAGVEIPLRAEPVITAPGPFEPYRPPTRIAPRITNPDQPD